MDDAVLTVRGLAARYGKVEALHGANVVVRAGQIVTVIGANGAGKSTLLNAIMGSLPARGSAQGEIRYAGQRIENWDVEQRVTHGMSLVPEKRELFASMSVLDNLRLQLPARAAAIDGTAGDAVLAITAACVAAGVPADAVGFIANVVGAQNVQVIGNKTSTGKVATYKFIEAILK